MTDSISKSFESEHVGRLHGIDLASLSPRVTKTLAIQNGSRKMKICMEMDGLAKQGKRKNNERIIERRKERRKNILKIKFIEGRL